MDREDDPAPKPPHILGPMKHGRHFSEGLVRDAQQLFQTRAGRDFSEDETRVMLARLTGFFRTLIEWDIKQKKDGGEIERDDSKGKIKNYKR
jgi:hypothetical protein